MAIDDLRDKEGKEGKEGDRRGNTAGDAFWRGVALTDASLGPHR